MIYVLGTLSSFKELLSFKFCSPDTAEVLEWLQKVTFSEQQDRK